MPLWEDQVGFIGKIWSTSWHFVTHSLGCGGLRDTHSHAKNRPLSKCLCTLIVVSMLNLVIFSGLPALFLCTVFTHSLTSSNEKPTGQGCQASPKLIWDKTKDLTGLRSWWMQQVAAAQSWPMIRTQPDRNELITHQLHALTDYQTRALEEKYVTLMTHLKAHVLRSTRLLTLTRVTNLKCVHLRPSSQHLLSCPDIWCQVESWCQINSDLKCPTSQTKAKFSSLNRGHKNKGFIKRDFPAALG